MNKIGQLARSVNKFPARSFALRSSFPSASRIMPSLAWLYSLNTSASLCRSILRHHVIGNSSRAQPRGKRVTQGEDGVSDLSRSFLLAGSRSVVATLWARPDCSRRADPELLQTSGPLCSPPDATEHSFDT